MSYVTVIILHDNLVFLDLQLYQRIQEVFFYSQYLLDN